jgi:hypothetical protein
MPEKVGTITGFIKKRDQTVFGLNLDGDEYLYSFPDKRAEPWDADKVKVGDVVRIEYSPYEKAGQTKQYLAVIERLDGAQPPTPSIPGEPGQPTASTDWGYEQKDRLMCRESCLKTAGNIFAASIQAGHFEHHPPHGLVTDYARALEKWCLGALRAEEPEPELDEIPFE